MFNPPAMPFGNYKLQPSTGGYYYVLMLSQENGKNPTKKVKVMGKNCLTENLANSKKLRISDLSLFFKNFLME